MISKLSFFAVSILAQAACAPASPSIGSSSQGLSADQNPAPPKTITVAINEDFGNFWDGITGGGGGGGREIGHLVNQYLVALQPDASPTPRLLEELPSAEKGTWTVSPDGSMKVTWKLRPNVLWHDGTPFTANDVMFSWQVNRDPEIPNGNQAAVKLIQSMEARDAHTIVSTWRQAYPFADRLEHREFFPLAKHLLGSYYPDAKDQLLLQPYFSADWVGTGPFRVERWEHGSELDLVAFDRYFLGRPKLDRVRVQFISDENTAVANLRAGMLNAFLPTGGPTFDQVMTGLKPEWDASKRGTILTESSRWFFADAQKSPAKNPQPASLTDVRVRQALLYAIDRQALAQATFGDLGVVADSWVHPSFSYYAQMKNALTPYPYDPRRASAVLAELGWQRGADGVLERGAEKFSTQLRYRDTEPQANVIRENWKAIGVNGNLEFLSENLLRDRAARAQYTGFDLGGNPMGGLSAVRRFIGEASPTPENKWSGTNRGSYSNPAWDDVGQRLRITVDEAGRLDLERELVRVFSADVPALPLYYELDAIPVGNGLTGVQPLRGVAHTGVLMHTWNAHEWDVQ